MKSYTVEFYSLVNYGGSWRSDGVTNIIGFDEEYTTESKDDALKEFKKRKEIVTKDNMLGVTLSTWEDDAEIEQENYSSEDCKDN